MYMFRENIIWPLAKELACEFDSLLSLSLSPARMEVADAVVRRLVGFRWCSSDASPFSRNSGRRSKSAVAMKTWTDESHRLYYASPARCGFGGDVRRKEEKRRAALAKDLFRDLSAFYSTGFGVEKKEGTAREVREKMIMEAAELLMTELNQLKTKEKEMKKKKKEEKTTMKAAKMRNCAENTSSSSFSESSQSDCDEVVDMNRLWTADLQELMPMGLDVTDQSPECNHELPSAQFKADEKAEQNHATLKLDQKCESTNSFRCYHLPNCSTGALEVAKPLDKIEVCIGGKCKKSGAMELLEEFEKKVGIEGAVVGCKCMGKCKQGPNVRVVNHDGTQDELVELSKKSFCIGVGLEDVSAIVADFLVQNGIDMGLLAA